MNIQAYVIDLSLVLVALGLYLHVSDCERKNLSRAKLDEHVAAIVSGEKPLASRQGEVLGFAGRDVVPSADRTNGVHDVDHVRTTEGGGL